MIAALGALERDPARLAELDALATTRNVSDVHFAIIHIALGEIDSALAYLEKAEAARSGWLVYLATEPRFDPLRGEKRFTDLVARIHRA